jgi:hypothetical protein
MKHWKKKRWAFLSYIFCLYPLFTDYIKFFFVSVIQLQTICHIFIQAQHWDMVLIKRMFFHFCFYLCTNTFSRCVWYTHTVRWQSRKLIYNPFLFFLKTCQVVNHKENFSFSVHFLYVWHYYIACKLNLCKN